MGTSSKRVVSEGKVSWNNYEGSKESHEVNATQQNLKLPDGTHIYVTKEGKTGAALGNAERPGQKK